MGRHKFAIEARLINQNNDQGGEDKPDLSQASPRWRGYFVPRRYLDASEVPAADQVEPGSPGLRVGPYLGPVVFAGGPPSDFSKYETQE